MVRSIVDLSLFPFFIDIEYVSDFFCEGCEGIVNIGKNPGKSRKNLGEVHVYSWRSTKSISRSGFCRVFRESRVRRRCLVEEATTTGSVSGRGLPEALYVDRRGPSGSRPARQPDRCLTGASQGLNRPLNGFLGRLTPDFT